MCRGFRNHKLKTIMKTKIPHKIHHNGSAPLFQFSSLFYNNDQLTIKSLIKHSFSFIINTYASRSVKFRQKCNVKIPASTVLFHMCAGRSCYHEHGGVVL